MSNKRRLDASKAKAADTAAEEVARTVSRSKTLKAEPPEAAEFRRIYKLPPEVESVLRFISQNMKLSGFSGTITPETEQQVLRLYRVGKLKRRKPLFRPR